ncbi:hypothetical protein HWV00_05835 [Moritella sp. 24]|uniref:hypothetical protein n=1 Tax=Moritella sp. 24 TaxID=2746230 RepID=UPI001BACC084|nr:hypothetical protein [Moritella sp. 24]QUM75788.1 hypothetical protein HWV00_05835 [Moritella sp. 24]
MKLYNALLLSSLPLFSAGSFAANDASAEVKIGMFKCGPNSEMRCPHLWFKDPSARLIQSERVRWTYAYDNDSGDTSAKAVAKDMGKSSFAEKTASKGQFVQGSFFKVTKVCADKSGFCWVPGNEGYAEDSTPDSNSSGWVTYELVSQNHGTESLNDDPVNAASEPKVESFNTSLAPPSRPESFSTPEELKKYLKELNEYYAIVGRPR